MKINTSYWKDDPDDKKSRRADWVAQARREAVKNEESAALKHRQVESPFKEENKFSGILESATTQQKLKQTNENSGEGRREDEKKDRKNAAHEKDSSDGAAVNDRIERNASQFGGQFGGNGGFGSDVNQTNHLSENFAARSILHIADLERMISAVRKLTKLDGKREITIELKNSVMEGLKVKITTGDATHVNIEFLAANEKIRSQIEDHSEELSNILRGRGVNLQSLRATIYADSSNSPEVFDSAPKNISSKSEASSSNTDDLFENNTFRSPKN